MHPFTRCLASALLLLPMLLATAHAQAPLLQDVTPPLTDEPLNNPGMGLYLFATRNAADMPADAWFDKLLNIGYDRDDWAKLQPDGDNTAHFDEYFKPLFDLWVNQWHKRLAFRFMSSNMHSSSRYVTPQWVFDQGVPSIHQKGIYVPDQVVPVFWDEKYLAVQEKFIAELGKYLDGRPGLEFIDIGGIGEWGEMHLARWTGQQLQETGYTKTKYIAAYRRLIDAYARAFPHTRVFLNVGDYAAINDYAALRGEHFRQDGLNPNGPSANVGKRFYHTYSRRGVICNYELFSGYDEMKQKGWGVKETFDKGLEDPISYLHINLMGYRQLLTAPEEVKTAVTDAARRIGFRFVPTKVRCNQTLRLSATHPARLLIESTWQNLGVAPCYDSYALRWSLLNAAGQPVVEQVSYPDTPTTQWWPRDVTKEATTPAPEIALHDVLTVPGDLPPGAYRLKVAMFKPEDGTQIQLGIAGRDAADRYDIAALAAARVSDQPSAVYEEGFEAGAGGWAPERGLTARTDAGGHSGQSALLVEGTQPGSDWGYASVTLKTPVLPASRYRLSCWMKVDKLQPASKEPYLKIGLTDATGKWLANFGTSHYDTAHLGTWQLLTGYVETTPDTAGGQLAIEKGDLESHITATIRLDDVRLELLESP